MYGNLNYFENSLFSIFAVTGCLSVYVFASLVGITVGITSSAVGLDFTVYGKKDQGSLKIKMLVD